MGLGGVAGDQVGAGGGGVVGELEAGAYGAAEQGEGIGSGVEEAGALPDVAGDYELRALVGGQVGADDVGFGVAVGMELEHFYGGAEVVVEDFVAGEDVHFGEGAGFEEVVDGGAGAARSDGSVEVDGGFVGADVPAAFAGVRGEVEDALDVGGGHEDMVCGAGVLAVWMFQRHNGDSSLASGDRACLTSIRFNMLRTPGGTSLSILRRSALGC